MGTLCIKALGQYFSSILLIFSNVYLWMLGRLPNLDESMKYVTFVVGIISGIVYITLVVLKKRKEKKEIERINLEIELHRLEIEKQKEHDSQE